MAKGHTLGLTAAEGLENENRVQLLEIIDQLRELGISENVSLPQLVVVGDQSSGKSSLLEGLTGLSFPIASDLCTRFATQIVLRRAPAEAVGAKITIIAGPTSRQDDAMVERLASFEKRLELSTFGDKRFNEVFAEAAICMGLPDPNGDDLEDINKRFSDDILKIELSGPDHQHLSVVDVPGLFHNPTKFQTEEDRGIIRSLIETYITDKRTIILAVMDAKNNLANQGVFAMARAADPTGKRTVGIITKCDALQEGDEAGVLRIAKNDVEKLTYGWFVVRNRSTQDINEGVTIEGRHRKEQQFFSTTIPWTELKKDRVGIRALKVFLGILLYDHIRSEFPAVVADIEQLYVKILEELERLGPSRHTASEQRRFLTRMMTRYQQEGSKALKGNYDADLQASSPAKLRMHLRQLIDNFSRNMLVRGHKMMFRAPGESVDPEFRRSKNDGDIFTWIWTHYLQSRGSELPGTVSPAVIENLFRQQSSPWENIATTYVEEVFVAVTRYNATILTMIAPDRDVRDKLQNLVAQREKETSSSAHNQLHQILNDERGGILQTANHYYADTLSSIRKERAAARMIEIDLSTDLNSDENVHKIIKRTHMSNEEQTILDIHDILQAYYKVAIKRFVDNVIIQVSERYIQGDSGPMKLFSPDVISDFDDNRLAYIAGESLATSVNRRDLLEKAVRFKKALNRARQAAL